MAKSTGILHDLTDEIFAAESIIQKFTDYLEGNDSWWYGVDWKRMTAY